MKDKIEPVALPAAMHPHDFDNLPEAHCNGFNACLDEIAKLGPLYAHPAPADTGEVERLRGSVNEWESKWQQETAQAGLLSAQLAEANASLKHWMKRTASLNEQLGERDALLMGHRSLLRQVMPCLAMSTNSQAANYMRQIEAALSASTEPNHD